ncbi:MAG TPA: ParB/RepB/Spo0J family partition protein [Micropepsaceae bacterium]|nr:ParB/RepB/Spo0J family partition protein [Micropepsaceae bacterium]
MNQNAPTRSGPRGLGKGLSALLGDETAIPAQSSATGARMLPVSFLTPNPFQPRRHFDDEELTSLADSIAAKGVLQPILVRPTARHDSFQIIAGERRWRAAQKARLHEVPVIVRELNDSESLEIAIIENVQRSDLNPIEEAAAYQELIDRFSYTQEKMAGAIGKSRSHIANLLRLLKLPPRIQTLLSEGKITAGHGRMLVTAADPEAMAEQIISQGLNVREVEKKARQAKQGKTAPPKDSDTKALEHALSDALGLSVSIEHNGQKGGAITIRYRSLDQLDQVIRMLQRGSA